MFGILLLPSNDNYHIFLNQNMSKQWSSTAYSCYKKSKKYVIYANYIYIKGIFAIFTSCNGQWRQITWEEYIYRPQTNLISILLSIQFLLCYKFCSTIWVRKLWHCIYFKSFDLSNELCLLLCWTFLWWLYNVQFQTYELYGVYFICTVFLSNNSKNYEI